MNAAPFARQGTCSLNELHNAFDSSSRRVSQVVDMTPATPEGKWRDVSKPHTAAPPPFWARIQFLVGQKRSVTLQVPDTTAGHTLREVAGHIGSSAPVQNRGSEVRFISLVCDLLRKQRVARKSQVVDMTAGSTLGEMSGEVGPTNFLGYGQLEADGTIVALLQGGRPVDCVAAGEL